MEHVVRKQSAVVLVGHYLPQLLGGVLGVGIETHAEAHSGEAAALELNGEFLSGNEVVLAEIETCVAVAVVRAGLGLGVGFGGCIVTGFCFVLSATLLFFGFCSDLFGTGSHIGERADPVGINIIEHHDGLDDTLARQSLHSVDPRRRGRQHQATLGHAGQHEVGRVGRAVVGRQVARRTKGVDAGGVGATAGAVAEAGQFAAKRKMHGRAVLYATEVYDGALNPAVAVPGRRAGHLPQGVEQVDIVVRHGDGAVGHRLVYLVGERRRTVLQAESGEVTHKDRQVDVERSRQAPRRLATGALGGVLEDVVVPQPVIGVEPQGVVVAAGFDVVRGRLTLCDVITPRLAGKTQLVALGFGHDSVRPYGKVDRLRERKAQRQAVFLHEREAGLASLAYRGTGQHLSAR